MSSKTISLSVCLVTRNHAPYIERSLESIIEQAGHVDMEIIIGDDCSDDGTSEIASDFALKHPNLIRHIRHDPRVGGSENYISILKAARGEFIAYLDGDDYWLPGKLERQLSYMMSNAACAATYSNSLAITESGTPIGRFNDAPDIHFTVSHLVSRGNFLNTSSMIFRAEHRDSITEIEGALLDYKIHLHLAQRGYVYQFNEPLVAYRVNSATSTVAQHNDFIRGLYWEAITSVPRSLIDDKDFGSGIANFYRSVILKSVRTRRWSLMRSWAAPVFQASPYGWSKTSLMVFKSLLRSILWEGKNVLRQKTQKSGGRVFYHY